MLCKPTHDQGAISLHEYLDLCDCTKVDIRLDCPGKRTTLSASFLLRRSSSDGRSPPICF